MGGFSDSGGLKCRRHWKGWNEETTGTQRLEEMVRDVCNFGDLGVTVGISFGADVLGFPCISQLELSRQ